MSDLKDSINEIPALKQEVKSLIATVKEALFGKSTQKFKDVKLKDGTIASYEGEMPSPGMPFFVIDKAGNKLPAPDGEHTAEDGTVFVVTGGMIAEVKPAAPAAEEGMQDATQPAAQAPTQEQAVKGIVESIIKETIFSNKSYEEKFSALEKQNSELKSEVEKLSKLLKETFSIVEKIADSPSEKPTEKKNDGFMKKPQNRLERLMSEAKELTNKTFKN